MSQSAARAARKAAQQNGNGSAPAPARKRASRAKKPDADAPPVEAVDQPAAQEQLNGVVLHVVPDPGGKPIVKIQTSGDVRLTEVDTILRLARKQLSEALGVD